MFKISNSFLTTKFETFQSYEKMEIKEKTAWFRLLMMILDV